MKEINLSSLLTACGYDPEDDNLRIVIDFHAHFSFPKPDSDFIGNAEYPGFAVHFPGFGDNETDDAFSEPLLVEYPIGNGENFPSIYVWTDINHSDPERLTLECARTEMREPE